MAYINLTNVLEDAWVSLETRWAAGTLPADFNSFIAAVIAIFPSEAGDNTPAERTVSNWIVMCRLAQNENVTANVPPYDAKQNPSYAFYLAALDALYRLVWAALDADAATPPRETPAQSVALLAACNAYLS